MDGVMATCTRKSCGPGPGTAAGDHRGLDEVKRNIFDPLDEEWWNEVQRRPDEFLAGQNVVVIAAIAHCERNRQQLDVPFVISGPWKATGNPVPPVPEPQGGGRSPEVTDLSLTLAPAVVRLGIPGATSFPC